MTPETGKDWIRYRPLAPGVEWVSAFFSTRAFSLHRHDTYALGVTTTGVQTFGYRGETRHALAGDTYVLHPDELHDGRPGTDQGFGFTGVYVSPELIGAARPGITLPFVAEVVSRHPTIKSLIRSITARAQGTPDDLFVADVLAQLTDGLWHLAGSPNGPGKLDPIVMGRVREHLLHGRLNGVTTAELERRHGMDRFTMSRQFRALYGVSPHRFLTQRRLDEAKRMILAGMTLAECAAASGFADQSHMTRHFRDTVGFSPAAWRDLVA